MSYTDAKARHYRRLHNKKLQRRKLERIAYQRVPKPQLKLLIEGELHDKPQAQV